MSNGMFQRAVYDGLWSLLAETLAEQQRLIQDAWELPDLVAYDAPEHHERMHTIRAIIEVYTEAQREIIRACGQGWYSSNEARWLYLSCVQHMEWHHTYANRPFRGEGESLIAYQRDRHDTFLRAHLWARLIRKVKPIYEASKAAR